MSNVKSIATAVFAMKLAFDKPEDYAALKSVVRDATFKIVRARYGDNVNWNAASWTKKLVAAVLASDLPMSSAARARLENNDVRNSRVELEHTFDVAIMTKMIIAAESVVEVEHILDATEVILLTKEEHLAVTAAKKSK